MTMIQADDYAAKTARPVLGAKSSASARTNAAALPLPPDHVWESKPILSEKPRGAYRVIGKRLFDISVVLLSAPFTLPIILLCAIGLMLEGGSPFYRQQRVGKDGKMFSILKLRTMVKDADKVLEDHLARDPEMRREWNELQKLRNDPRVTKMGAILRSTSFDELPQLWNVLTGDMSIVGPRPMMPCQREMYGNMQSYAALRPGITGFWQISARNENAFSFRNEIDAQYDNQLGFVSDVKVMLKTVVVMARRTGC